MENIEVYENEHYKKAKNPENSWLDMTRYLLNAILIVLQITCLMCFEPFYAIYKYLKSAFNSDKKENKRSIKDQIALVTGGANGLGREIAFRLAQEKCKIAICDINFNDAQRTAEEIAQSYSVKAAAFKVDVSNASAIKDLKSKIESSLGPVDILVNNAGILPLFSFRECSDEHLQKFINVNFTSHFWTTRTFIKGMIERKRGKIVAISSLSGKMSLPLMTTYSTTKSAIGSFMRSLQDELYCHGHDEYIKLTTVFPNFINTRKELEDILNADEKFDIMPRLRTEDVADEIVNGIKNCKRDITIPKYMSIFAWFSNNIVTHWTQKKIVTKLVSFDVMRLKQIKMLQDLENSSKIND